MAQIRNIRTRDRLLPLPYLSNERGMLLVITMLVLLVLTTLGAASLINSYLERSLARNQNYASIALSAADAGVADAITWLKANKASVLRPTDFGYNANWTQCIPNNADCTVTHGLASGGAYRVRIRYKKERRDYDGNGDCAGRYGVDNVPYDEEGDKKDGDGNSTSDADQCCSPADTCADKTGEVVLFNSPSGDGGFSYTGSLFDDANTGYPVVEIRSVGTFGAGSYREVAVDVARNRLDITVTGAITARGATNFTGSFTADGNNYDDAGVKCTDAGSHCSCAAAGYPPVTVSGTTAPTPAPGGSFDGPAGMTGPETSHGENPSSPYSALGMDEDEFKEIIGGSYPAVNAGVKVDAINFYNGDYHYGVTNVAAWGGTLPTGDSGVAHQGLVIVHNPLFESQKWDVSVVGSTNYLAGACADKLANANYDARLDSACWSDGGTFKTSAAPRTFDMQSNDTFKGIIIADKVDKLAGTPTVLGAVISLSSIDVNQFGAGTANVRYSCDAIESATSGSFTTRLGWHRLR